MKDTAVLYCDRRKVIMIILNDLNDLANANMFDNAMCEQKLMSIQPLNPAIFM
jgi:hypothetical protein